MRIEFILFVIAGAVIYNIYTDGRFLKQLFSYQKYYKMAGVAFFALMLFYLFRKNPNDARNIITTTNDYIKYLPLDRSTSSFITPILDFTSKQNFQNDAGFSSPPFLSMGGGGGGRGGNNSQQRLQNSGKGSSTKRSVSETKKKYVAASQNWHCGQCQKQLPAWFEVDHKIRLEYGGSNHIDNLVALCRDCHGQKTAVENL